MKEYQRRKNNPYLLPHHLYMRVLYTIRDYDRLKENANDIIDESPLPPDGQPTTHSFNNSPTENKAVKLSEIDNEIIAIETSLNYIPEFYRKGVLNNIMYGKRYPTGADFRTFQRYKQKYIYFVAKKLKLI